MKVTIVDYGAGNLPSVERAFHALGAETERATSPAQVESAEVIVLPGVGHFAAFVTGLRNSNLTESLRAAHDRAVPMLGICLGLQALFTSSQEAPGEAGLDLISGEVAALPPNVKSPHIGWNQVQTVRDSKLLRDIPRQSHFYFAHSYAAPAEGLDTVAICDVADNGGVPFAAVVERKNLMAVQFHPEKSGDLGAQVLRNFLESAQ